MSATRIEDFFARVDARLAELSPAEAGDFLDRLIEQWDERYADFQRRVARGAPPRGTMDAFDYTATIAGLDQRRSTATAEARADLQKWHDAYRKSDAYRARFGVQQAAE